MRRLFASTTVLAALFAPAAAGGLGVAAASSKSSSGSTFVRNANRQCAAAGSRVMALPPAKKTNVVSELRKVASIVSSLVTNLRKVKAPPSKAPAYRTFLATTEKQVAEARAVASALQAHRTKKAIAILKKVAQDGARSDRQASALGLTACAKSYKVKGA